jgi:hypothetical protein
MLRMQIRGSVFGQDKILYNAAPWCAKPIAARQFHAAIRAMVAGTHLAPTTIHEGRRESTGYGQSHRRDLEGVRR